MVDEVRLIDANAFKGHLLIGAEFLDEDTLLTVLNILDCEITIDPESLRPKGRWFLLDECANAGVYCSVCTKKVYKEQYANQKLKSPYCPNCGAKMEG